MGSITVLARTQRIIVDESKRVVLGVPNRHVSIVNAGPQGPAGVSGISVEQLTEILNNITSLQESIESLGLLKAGHDDLNTLQDVLTMAIAEAKAEVIGSAPEEADTLSELHDMIEELEASGLEGYHHSQPTPASVWVVNHNKGRYLTPTRIEDSGGTQWFGVPHHIDENTLTLSFFVAGEPVAFSGEADFI